MPTINIAAPTADLEVTSGVDWDFDIQWWQSDGTTPINITACEAALVSDYENDPVLNFSSYLTLSQNVIRIRIPGDVTKVIDNGHYVWYCNATSTTGEKKALCRGKVRVYGG
jgi:hypothetical protein